MDFVNELVDCVLFSCPLGELINKHFLARITAEYILAHLHSCQGCFEVFLSAELLCCSNCYLDIISILEYFIHLYEFNCANGFCEVWL